MREIKFRAWYEDGEKMYEVDYINWCWEEHTIGLMDIEKRIELETDIKTSSYNNLLHLDISDVELMQYTGLKDKNGREIYEGDYFFQDTTKNVIVFDQAGFACHDKNGHFNGYLFSKKNIEIIGNIFET